jgi:hypothetical protein
MTTPITNAREFKEAVTAARKHQPETVGRLVSILCKLGHGAILADAIHHLSTDTGERVVKPNNAREVERMTDSLLGCFKPSKRKAKVKTNWGTSLDPTLPQNWHD